MPIKREENQADTKPQQSNALHPNELGLGRLRVMQPRVGPRWGKKPKYTPRIDVSFRELCIKKETHSSHELNMNFGLQ